MVKISIKKKKDLLQGIQDPITCQFDDYIFLIGGFCCGPDNRPHTSKYLANLETSYKRGFYNDIWRYCISENEWVHMGQIKDMKPRQGHFSEQVGNKLYIFGGLSYTPLSEEELKYYEANNISLPSKADIGTFADYFCLEYSNASLNLIDTGFLPYPITCSRCKYFNNNLYILNGCTYVNNGFDDEYNNVGKRLLVIGLDENNLIIKNKFEIIESFPGTSRFNSNLELINDQLYLFGGTHNSQRNIHSVKGYNETSEYNVMDNWKFDILKNEWTEIQMFPFTISNTNSIQFDNNIYFFGGCRYNQNIYKNEINYNFIPIEETKIWQDYNCDKKIYNGISTIPLLLKDGLYCRSHYNGYFGNIIFSYNTENKKFTILDELPMQSCLAILTKYIKNNKNYVFFLPNESNFILINNKYYGIHSSLFLRLKINK